MIDVYIFNTNQSISGIGVPPNCELQNSPVTEMEKIRTKYGQKPNLNANITSTKYRNIECAFKKTVSASEVAPYWRIISCLLSNN